MRQSSDDIVLVEGNNELNVQMSPIAPAPSAPFTFDQPTMENVRTCPINSWAKTGDFKCRITNNASVRGVHTLSLYSTLYSCTWGYTTGPYKKLSFELILEPGEYYDYSLDGYDPDYPYPDCQISVLNDKREMYWLEDELGFASGQAGISRC